MNTRLGPLSFELGFSLRVFAAMLWLALGRAQAADTMVTLTITVTNTPSAGNALVVNSYTRTWRASPTTPSTEIALGTNITSTASALLSHVSRYANSGPLQSGQPATNQVTLRGQVNQAITASVSGSWATLSYTTNNVTNAVAVRIPVTVEAAGTRGTIADGLVNAISTYALTNKFAASAPALDYFVDTSESQTISGDKTFLGATRFASPQTTNLVNRGNAVSSPGSVSGSEQFGASAAATGTNSLAVGNSATAAYLRGIGIGYAAQSDAVSAIGIGYAAIGGSAGDGDDGIALGTSASVTADRAIAIGSGADASGVESVVVGTDASDGGYAGAVVIGADAVATAANQIVLGSSSATVKVPGTLDGAVVTNSTLYGTIGSLTGGTIASSALSSATASNTTLTGTSVLQGKARIVHTTISSLANGVNSALDVGDYSFARLTAGPTAAFSLTGLAGGATGRLVVLYNATGQDWTIANESGTETTATNRITTCTGSDLTITGSGCAMFLYDGTSARWILVAYESPDLSSEDFVDVTSSQTITGPKVFASIATTNLVNYGYALSSPGSGTSSEEFGASASASGNDAVAVGNTAVADFTNAIAVGSDATASDTYAIAMGKAATASASYATAIGDGAAATGESAIAIGGSSVASGARALAFGVTATASGDDSIALGDATIAAYSHSVGVDASPSGAYQIALGGGSHSTYISGELAHAGKWVQAATSIGGLSSGTNSAVAVTSAATYFIYSGPVAAFTISGFANGSNGRHLEIINLTGQNLTLLHDNAAESTATNRIVSLSGANLTSTGNCAAHLIYDDSNGRWVVTHWQE